VIEYIYIILFKILYIF